MELRGRPCHVRRCPESGTVRVGALPAPYEAPADRRNRKRDGGRDHDRCETDLDKARAIYEWIVDNTFRNPRTRGCGIGDIRFMLESKDLGGKCADLNALYVGLARAAGLPARDVYGIRVAKSELGHKSLGTASENITKAQHCRAEVHIHDYGWVPVDPADVRKVVLEELPGNRTLHDELVEKARARLFGSWEMKLDSVQLRPRRRTAWID